MAFRVMSFNVRMDTEKDGDNRWDCRKEVVANIIRSQHPLVFGLQEPHKHQVEWLAGQLPEYAWVGKGRCPVVFGIGEEHCEYNPVFYDTTQLECSSSGTMWLSDTPWLPNTKFAGSAFPRIATYARLKRKDDGREFTFVCTHFDHEGEEPRTRSAALLVAKLQELSGGTPVVLVGDLNAGGGRAGSSSSSSSRGRGSSSSSRGSSTGSSWPGVVPSPPVACGASCPA
uniref:Endonuclease/exonuclease/phosphatase domain-containing protein n=1 Tax=Tetradesmus obliquus TaxID=3088 RepID=A0A383WE09_TETOB|eukprot:jgi/Sobl393_1/9271/SZX75837.1